MAESEMRRIGEPDPMFDPRIAAFAAAQRCVTVSDDASGPGASAAVAGHAQTMALIYIGDQLAQVVSEITEFRKTFITEAPFLGKGAT